MDKTVYYYTFLSTAGPVCLFPEGTGYKILVNQENLGAYSNPDEAFIAAVTGSTLTP